MRPGELEPKAIRRRPLRSTCTGTETRSSVTSAASAAMGVTRTIWPTTPPSSMTGMPGARPSRLPLLKTSRCWKPLAGSYSTSTTTAACSTVSVTHSRRRNWAFSAASWAACVATCESSMRWRCRASFSLRIRLAALTHSLTCWATSRGAMTARWNGYRATATARRMGSSTCSWESRTSSTTHRAAMTANRTSAGGPRLNSGGVPCRCMNTQPGPQPAATAPGGAGEAAPAGRTDLVVDENGAQFLKVLERLAAAAHHASQGILGHHDGQAGFFLEQAVEVAQQRAAAGQGDALVGDVRAQFGRGLLEGDLDRGNDLVERIGERLEDFVGRHREAARHALGQVAALDFDLAHLGAGEGRADFLLDQFGRGFADQHAVVAADVIDDGFVELVAADPHRPLVDHAAQGDDGDLGGAAADVHHHGAAGVGHGQPGADGRGHGFLDEVHVRGARAQGRFADGAALDLGGAAGHAHDDAR